jgi:predicted dehydrogenase
MRGFELFHAKRPSAFERIPVEDPVDAKFPDGRIAPVSRLARIFLDAIETDAPASPGFAEGHRVQVLIDAARRSHQSATWVDVTQAGLKKGVRA